MVGQQGWQGHWDGGEDKGGRQDHMNSDAGPGSLDGDVGAQGRGSDDQLRERKESNGARRANENGEAGSRQGDHGVLGVGSLHGEGQHGTRKHDAGRA